MPLSESQRLEFEEYLETILDLYSKDEYESDVENIVYHYCKRKFDLRYGKQPDELNLILNETTLFLFCPYNIFF